MFGRVFSLVRDSWRNRRGLPVRPRFLTYTVTYACNARCVMCDSWKIGTEGDLTTDDVARVFAALPRMDVVRLTGGEPFLRNDLPQIAELARRHLRPTVLHITTNGLLTDRIVDFCQRRERTTPLHLLVSIDGVGEKHNRVRGHSQAWDRALETIRRLAPDAQRLGLRLAVNQTIIDAEGVDHYRRLRDVLRPYGVQNQIVVAYDVSATYNTQREIDLAPTAMGQFQTFGDLGSDVVRRLLREAEEDLQKRPWWERWGKRYYLRGIGHRLLDQRGEPCPPCVALASHLRMLPNGDVPTCQFNSRTVGNLARQGFAAVWSSAVRETQRDWVRRCPGCWAECEVIPNALYSLDLLWPRRAANGR